STCLVDRGNESDLAAVSFGKPASGPVVAQNRDRATRLLKPRRRAYPIGTGGNEGDRMWVQLLDREPVSGYRLPVCAVSPEDRIWFDAKNFVHETVHLGKGGLERKQEIRHVHVSGSFRTCPAARDLQQGIEHGDGRCRGRNSPAQGLQSAISVLF